MLGGLPKCNATGSFFYFKKIEQLYDNSGGPFLPQLTKNQIWEKAFAEAFALRFGVHYLMMNEINLRPESKLSVFSDMFELDKPASCLLPNLGVPVPGTNSPDGQGLHP